MDRKKLCLSVTGQVIQLRDRMSEGDPGFRTFRVLGVRVDAVTVKAAIEHVKRLVQARKKGFIVFCTVSTVLEARRNPELVPVLSEASLVSPDGMPLVWLGRSQSAMPVERVYGPDFMLALMAATGGELRHYFYGGAPGVAGRMTNRLRQRFPDLVIAGVHSPPLDVSASDVDPTEVERINSARPDVVWVGLGHPKQEMWMHVHHPYLNCSVLAGVGAAFDFLSGAKREAPSWMKRSGLQWLHRLISEPRRLWRRYLIGNSLFVLLVLRERLGLFLRKK